MNLFTGTRELRRLRELVGILLRYGFDDLVKWLGMEGSADLFGRWFNRELPIEIRRQPPEVRARLALEEMGPTFVKFGQILATRVDLLPPEWISQLEELQDQTRALPFSQLKPLVEASLGARLSECFREVDEEPVGTASMAQVHRAVTLSGEEVVLKIRKPGIEEKIEADLRLMRKIAEIAEAQSQEMRRYHPVEIMQEFERSLTRELDFSIEARNADRMRENLRQLDFIKVPRIYWQWTCEDLNVQEFIRGISAKNVDELDRSGADRKQLARRGARAIWKMMLEDGFFHADPHPGNFIILPGNRIAMLDFGMVGRLTPTRRDQLIRLIRCVILQEPENASTVLIEWAGGRFVNREALSAEVSSLLERFDGVPINELDISALLNDVASILRNHAVRLPSDITLLVKACVTLEGFGRLIDPDFQLMEEAAPLLKKTLVTRYSPKMLVKSFRVRAMDAVERLYNPSVPIFGASANGMMASQSLDTDEVERLVNRLEKASHRQTRAILLASLFVVSGMITQIESGPHLLGLHVLGVLSLMGCSLYWVWMLVNIWWSERGHRS
ncbi:MAG: phosphotransferase [Moraxellaceae bacterium]|nr:phosphotransferase [Moraxellaceae bacterium]